MENSEDIKFVILNNGIKMPLFGLGTCFIDNADTLY